MISDIALYLIKKSESMISYRILYLIERLIILYIVLYLIERFMIR